MVLSLILVIFFLVLSFIFSGYETSFFNLRIGESELGRGKKGDWLRFFQSRETELLGTILISNLLVNVSASSLLSALSLNLFKFSPAKEFYLLLTSLLTALFIFIFCEATPKVYALTHPGFFFNLSPILIFLRRLFSPLVFNLAKNLDRLIKRKEKEEFPTEKELKGLLQLAEREGVLDREERDILLSLEDMTKVTLKSFLTPKRKIFALPEETTIGEAVAAAQRMPYSRIPVFRERVENITGLLYVKDLVKEKFSPQKREEKPVAKIMREVFFLPEGQSALDALDILRKKGSHLAIVVDEFGEVSGLVTLEDILEAIFGEIRDEYDISEEEAWQKIDEKTYIVSGDIDKNALSRLWPDVFSDLPEERLSGFIARHLGRLPEIKDRFVYRDIEIEVLEVVEKRVEKVILRLR